jgi:hypothetical protein
MKSEVEVGARAFASDRNHGACHWLINSRSLPNKKTFYDFYTIGI